MEVDRRGHVVRYEMHDGVINSDARMTYTAVNAILTDRDPTAIAEYRELVPMFELMRELFEILNARRRRRGSIDFDLPESRSHPVGVQARSRRSSRRAQHRAPAHRGVHAPGERDGGGSPRRRSAVPALHRVHEAPDVKKVAEFEAFIAPLGYSLARTGRTRHAEAFPETDRPHAGDAGRAADCGADAADDAEGAVRRGEPRPLRSRGGALHALHVADPALSGSRRAPHASRVAARRRSTDARREELEEELPEIARHTSEMERRADDAERELLQWKKVRFMADKVGDEFEGYITGVAPFGLFIELIEHYVEGLVHVSSMADDYYRFVEQQHVLRGENTKKVYRLGDKVRVQVVRVDMERRQVDLGLVEILETVRREERRRGPIREQGEAEDASAARRSVRGGASGIASSAGRRERTLAKIAMTSSSSFVASLKLRMPLPMPLPISGRRLAPKIRMMIARMMSSSGRPIRPICHLSPVAAAWRGSSVVEENAIVPRRSGRNAF